MINETRRLDNLKWLFLWLWCYFHCGALYILLWYSCVAVLGCGLNLHFFFIATFLGFLIQGTEHEAVHSFYCRPFIRLPIRLVWYIFLLVKWTRHSLGLRSHNHPLSAFYFVQLATHTRTFDCTSAQKHIGYSPIVSQEVSFFWLFDVFSLFMNKILPTV